MFNNTYFQDKLENFTCKYHPNFKVTNVCFDTNAKRFLVCPQCLVDFPDILKKHKLWRQGLNSTLSAYANNPLALINVSGDDVLVAIHHQR